MNITVLAFAVMAMLVIGFAAATVVRELKLQFPMRTQTGDSSLSRKSVNWLAAAALITALAICIFLM